VRAAKGDADAEPIAHAGVCRSPAKDDSTETVCHHVHAVGSGLLEQPGRFALNILGARFDVGTQAE
jgi:hypothetical protein